MFRKDLIDLLLNNPTSVHEIARLLDLTPKDVADDLRHLARSLRHSDYQLRVTPARCRKCGFTFSPDKITKPGKCPACRGTWISEPLLETGVASGNGKVGH